MKITDKYVFFWGEELSNFYPCNITYKYCDEELKFKSSEQMFMWIKAKTFNDIFIAEDILKADTPHKAKRLGKKVKGFDEKIWETKRELAMMTALRYKFSHENEMLLNFLLDKRFDNKTFVEASPFDTIWGIGMSENDDNNEYEENWKGLNLLGKCIGKIREELIKNINNLKV